MSIFGAFEVSRGHLLAAPEHGPVAVLPDLPPVTESGVLCFGSCRVTPRKAVLQPCEVPGLDPAQWITLAELHGLPVRVAIRLTAAVVRSLLLLHSAGGAHLFVDPAAVAVRVSALDAVMRSEAVVRMRDASGAGHADPRAGAGPSKDALGVDVVIGRYPVAPDMISRRALAGPLAKSFAAVAPEVTRVPGGEAPSGRNLVDGLVSGMSAAGRVSAAGRAATRRENTRTASAVPVLGRAADVWGVGSVLANLLSPEPLTTADLLAQTAQSPWIAGQSGLVAGLLFQCLASDPSRRPTLVEVGTNPVFGVNKPSALAPRMSADELIEQLRRRRKLLENSPVKSTTSSPVKVPQPPAGDSDGSSDDDDDDTEESDDDEGSEESSAASTSGEDEDDSDSSDD